MAPVDLDKLVIFDLETTGLEADCKIVQIAMTRGERIYTSLVNPGIPIPPETTAIHRITDDQVADKPFFADIVDDVLEFITDSVLSGFNVRKFDIPVLRREVEAVGRTFPALPVLDMFELNQKMNPRSLAWFYEHYTGEPMDAAEAHDAVYDCIATRKGFLGMFEKHPDLPTELEELSLFAEPDRIPIGASTWLVWTTNQCEPSFSRGKYRGWALTDVNRKEPSYLNWLKSIDADAVTKNIIHLFKTNRKEYIEALKYEHPLRLEPRYLEYREAMDRKDMAAYEELVELAEKTKNPSLAFLAAAWATQAKKEEARKLAETYLAMDDPNVNVEKRSNFLRKVLNIPERAKEPVSNP
ncbi:MAG: 3'-5' exonuclease [Acidobacteriota bacterium]|nr:3'-5' exonuclease [Acidobacteriota bacterium]